MLPAMEREKGIRKGQVFIIATIIIILILAAIILGTGQTPDNEIDTDNDGIIDIEDLDDDGDGVPDTEDAFPLDPTLSEPVEPNDNKTYEASATFILDSGNITFKCDLANTSEERQIGLMNRESMEQDEGMVFVFDSPLEVSFWMKDTLIPLDIIFINETGHIVNIAEAAPEPDVSDSLLTRYPSDGPILWVVEINQGICAAEGIVPGTYIEIDY